MFRHLRFLLIISTLSVSALAQDSTNGSQSSANGSQSSTNSGSVLIETQDDYSLSYKKRRGTHGALFSVFSEVFDPYLYQSGYSDGYIGDFFGGVEFRLNGLELGYKYNVSMFSIAGLFSYSTGSGAKSDRSLQFTKQSFAVNAALDAIFEEPILVPYGQFNINTFDIQEEKAGSEDFAESTSPQFSYRYGVLLQLDFLESMMDDGAKAERLFSSGLENTFIDIYYSEYIASSSAQPFEEGVTGQEGEANLESSGQMGIGLKMEF